jgi:5-methylcytosine-specific restriction protein A
MSTRRTMPGAYTAEAVHPDDGPKGPNGRNLCRWCHQEVPQGRRTFCSPACVDEWRIRTDTQFMRKKVFERDQGVCAVCGINTEALKLALRSLQFQSNYVRVVVDGKYQLEYWKSCGGRTAFRDFLHSTGLKWANGSTGWHAHHKHAVVEGGGECGLDNYETVCIVCHKKETKELHGRLKRARKQQVQPELM